MPLISIIIPMHNVERYISRSINSCINQTLSNIEILIIDDCGSDNSLNIAKSFAKKDKRIKIINNPQNLGLFHTRIVGEKNANGAYILALDGDDYISNYTCKILKRAIFQTTALISKITLIKNLKLKLTIGGGIMNNIPLISIIIPMYNVEKYISRSITSCINQTLSDIEILIIHDCGSDNSLNIAKSFAKKDKRIKIINNPQNLGTFNARMQGIKEANGYYLLFLDADDYLALNACEVAINAIKESNPDSAKIMLDSAPDIIHFKSHYLADKNSTILNNLKHKVRYILPTHFSSKNLQNEAIAYNFFLKSYHFPRFTIWDKCYKATLLQKAHSALAPISQNLTMAEDMLKFIAITKFAKSYIGVNERLYVYCLNAISATQNQSKILERITQMQLIRKSLKILNSDSASEIQRQIAKRMRSNLKALMILELRNLEDFSCLDSADLHPAICKWLKSSVFRIKSQKSKIGGGQQLYSSALFENLLYFAYILEAKSYIYSYICLYFQLWIYQTLNFPSTNFINFRISRNA